jgi:hypothetical protein
VAFKTVMQRWNMPSDAIVIGHDYQGMGLRDTMSDLITATTGALIAGTFSYFAYGRKRRTLSQVMMRALPHLKRR